MLLSCMLTFCLTILNYCSSHLPVVDQCTGAKEDMPKDHTRVKGDMLSTPKQDLVKFKSQLGVKLNNPPKRSWKGEWP